VNNISKRSKRLTANCLLAGKIDNILLRPQEQLDVVDNFDDQSLTVCLIFQLIQAFWRIGICELGVCVWSVLKCPMDARPRALS